MSIPLHISYDIISEGEYVLERMKKLFKPEFQTIKEMADVFVEIYNAKEIEEKYEVGIYSIEAVVIPYYHIVFNSAHLEGIARFVTTEVVLGDRRHVVNDPQLCENILRPYFASDEVSNEQIRAAVAEACFRFSARWDNRVFAYVAQHLSEYYKYAAERYDEGHRSKDVRWKVQVLDKLQSIQHGIVDDEIRSLVKRELELLFDRETSTSLHDLGEKVIKIVSRNYLKPTDREKYYEIIADLAIPDLQQTIDCQHALFLPTDSEAVQKLSSYFTDEDGNDFIIYLKKQIDGGGINNDGESAILAHWLRMDALTDGQKRALARYAVEKFSSATRLDASDMEQFRYLSSHEKKNLSSDYARGIQAFTFISYLGYIDPRPSPFDEHLLLPSREVLDIIVDGFKDQYLPEILEMGLVDLDRGIELFTESKTFDGYPVDPQSITNALEGNGAQCFAALAALRASQKVATHGTELSRN